MNTRNQSDLLLKNKQIGKIAATHKKMEKNYPKCEKIDVLPHRKTLFVFK